MAAELPDLIDLRRDRKELLARVEELDQLIDALETLRRHGYGQNDTESPTRRAVKTAVHTLTLSADAFTTTQVHDAMKVPISRPTVRLALDELVDEGKLDVVSQGGPGRPTYYRTKGTPTVFEGTSEIAEEAGAKE